jgi:hypothetical protein
MDPQCTQRIPVMSSITGSLPQPAHVVLPSIHRMTGGKEGTQEEPAKQTLPPIHEVLGNNHRFAYSEGPSFSPSLKPGNWENVPPLRVPDMVSLDQRPSFHHELQIQTQKSPPTPSRIMENPQISSIQSFSSNNTIVPTRRPERVPISCTQNLSHNGYFLPHSANSVASSDGFRHFQRLPYGCLSVSRVLSGPPVSSARHYTASGQEVRPSISVAKFKGGQGLARSVSKQRTRVSPSFPISTIPIIVFVLTFNHYQFRNIPLIVTVATVLKHQNGVVARMVPEPFVTLAVCITPKCRGG